LVVEQIVKLKGDVRKETGKNVGTGLRMMRAEEESGDGNRLPPVSVMLGTKVRSAGGAKNLEIENLKAMVPEKKVKKVLIIPEPVIEELDMGSGQKKKDFGREQRNEVRVEIPHDI